MNKGKRTASYKVTADSGGWIFRFFCDSSGQLCCVTATIQADSEAAALDKAWQSEGKKHFNHCDKCGRYVSAAMFNVEENLCVDCAPWEDAYPNFCHSCGGRLSDPEAYFCPRCGAALHSGGDTEEVIEQ